ncbi:hypothetical protein PV08_05853 [Exophiala spinifera]|uniref:CENP-V/GFA domain-containing protein n=1 Tax=Exophiala spinifera TaxID=91928 RepID=A0A0D2B9X4_9EURO|nr:uncharacterized protein PV08_05853 [Exophiala spinifera]KIW15803.1 hypothetical protein PV08_05853 [Exophiala spinifera]
MLMPSVCANILKISKEVVKITGEDSIKIYLDSNTLSGRTIERHFCRNCGSPIQKITPKFPDMTDVQMGLFDRIPKPEFEVFTDRKQTWEPENEWSIPQQYETVPGWASGN